MFAIVTDSSANLDYKALSLENITVAPFSYNINGEEHSCPPVNGFDGTAYYDAMRNGAVVVTSQVTPHVFKEKMTPLLAEGPRRAVCRHVLRHKRILLLCRSGGKGASGAIPGEEHTVGGHPQRIPWGGAAGAARRGAATAGPGHKRRGGHAAGGAVRHGSGIHRWRYTLSGPHRAHIQRKSFHRFGAGYSSRTKGTTKER